MKPAADLAEKAAESGEAVAFYVLAAFYANGVGRDRDPRKATQLLKEFGKSGDVVQKFKAGQKLLYGHEGRVPIFRNRGQDGKPGRGGGIRLLPREWLWNQTGY